MEDVRFKVFDLAMTNRVGLGGAEWQRLFVYKPDSSGHEVQRSKADSRTSIKKSITIAFQKIINHRNIGEIIKICATELASSSTIITKR